MSQRNVIWTLILLICVVAIAWGAFANAEENIGRSAGPIEAHLALGELGDGHVHIYIRQSGVSSVEVNVLAANRQVIAKYTLAPSYASEERAEGLIKLPPEVARAANSAEVVAYRTKMERRSGVEARTILKTVGEAVPMAGCTGFCITFRHDCNYFCWAPPCCGYVAEGGYWCGGDYPNCDGSCECECPLPCPPYPGPSEK